MHRLSAAVKLVAVVGIVLALVALPHGWSTAVFLTVCGGVAAGWLGVAWASRLSLLFLLKRVLLLEPFVLGVAALSLWQPHGGSGIHPCAGALHAVRGDLGAARGDDAVQ